MTAQIEDKYSYKGRKYDVVAMTSPIAFHPVEYGFQPEPPYTSCWRGYVCEYAITDEELYLCRLNIFCGDNPYPEFEGIRPVKDKDK